MTTVTVYRSSDASAPTLTGQVGSLLGILDACLVNGFGAKSAAGWSKPFANSGNVGCYQNAGTGYCLGVNDNGPGAGGAKEARVVGFTSLSSVSAGSGQFPTNAQSSIGTGQLVVRKSNTADGTVRAWTIVADSTCFYMFCETGDFAAPLMALPFMFGDFFSYSATDTNNCAIIGRTAENTSNSATSNTQTTFGSCIETFCQLCPTNSALLSTVITGHYAAASFTGVGGSIPFGKHSDLVKMGANGNTNFNVLGWNAAWGASAVTYVNEFAYPAPTDSGLWIAPVAIHHNGYPHGYLKGLWCPLQHLPLNHNDVYSISSGNLSGKSMLAQSILAPLAGSGAAGGNNSPGQVHVETSSTWN